MKTLIELSTEAELLFNKGFIPSKEKDGAAFNWLTGEVIDVEEIIILLLELLHKMRKH